MSDDDQETKAHCPKCGAQLIYVTSVPHPRSPAMQRTTFVCYPCNRTWSYALAPEMAEAYAASNADNGTPPPTSASELAT
jgi:transposase-like protein